MDDKSSVSPLIILPGINHSPVYLYGENGEPVKNSQGKDVGGTLLIPDVDAFKEKLPGLIKAIALSSVTRKSEEVRARAYECGKALCRAQKCGKDGNFVNNLKVKRFEYPISEMDEETKKWAYVMVPIQGLTDKIGEENVFFFTFNLAGDPMESAKELKDYVALVKEKTGSEKVSFLPVSLGGTILTAYAYLYGLEDIDRIVNIVACLDGTDIVADIFAGEFDTSDRFLRHELLPAVIKEETGKALPGYAANILLHALPEKAFTGALDGFIGGMLDEFMLYCPQFWAMVPSYRYDALAEKRLSSPELKELKSKTDAFQKARLSLGDTLIKAQKDGVKIDFIAAGGLSFGDKEYGILSAVKSKNAYSTDGVVNLSSETLGAYGAPKGQKLPKGYRQVRECAEEPGYSYVSPDGSIDASRAALPDNVWIFCGQHHEVGKNSAVLNLAADIYLGKVKNVHSDPQGHPQFNNPENTYHLRRWRLADAKRALEDVYSGKIKTAPSVKARLEQSIKDAEKVLESRIADEFEAEKVKREIDDILIRLGRAEAPAKESKVKKAIEKAAEKISEATV